MKIRLDDIYREQFAKYNFVSTFTSGKILDITYGKYLDYVKSELLLKNGAKEIWSLDLLDVEQYLTLRQLDNDKIVYQIKSKDELDLMSFDTILAFNILSIVDDYNDTLKFIFDHLNPNGTAIISIINDDGLLDNNHDLITKDLNLFSKNSFEQTLKLYFNSIIFFSQGTVTSNEKEEHIKNKLRIKIKNFFLKSVKRYNFYLKNLHSINKFFINITRNRENKKTHRYEIIPFHEENKPLFTIAQCKK